MNRRYKLPSTMLNSNKGSEGWGQILGDEVMAAPLQHLWDRHAELSMAIHPVAKRIRQTAHRKGGRSDRFAGDAQKIFMTCVGQCCSLV